MPFIVAYYTNHNYFFIIQLLSPNMSILVNPHLVVQTLNAKKSIIKVSAHVYHLILEVHLVVDQNVLSVPNVLMIKHVRIKNVLTLAQTLVDKMPSVELIITVQFAHAWKVTQEIHSPDAILNHVRFSQPP